MRSYWVQFATTGNPDTDGLPDWPRLTPQEDTYMDLGDKIQARSGLEAEICSALSAD
jgi:carboxylesterase type B